MNEDNRFTSDMNEEDTDKEKQTAGEEHQKKDVDVVIEVSEDKFEAYLTLVPLTDSPEFSTDELIDALSGEGVIVGIQDAVIALLKKEPQYNKKLLIASGTKPKKGKRGKINYFFISSEAVKVKKGEKIGEIVTPEDGVDGITVFAEEVPVPEAKKAKIPKLTNVEFSPDNDDLLIAGIDGYLFIDIFSIKIAPFFKLEELADEYEAYIEVKIPLHEDDYNGEDLKRFLKDCEIVYGILEEEVENIFQQEKYEQPILIARGRKVVHDQDGEIKYFFSSEVKPRIDEEGNVDYKEIDLIKNVKKGDKLAEILPPVKGEEGCTIFGKKIPPGEGVIPPLPTGQNVQPDPKNPDVLLAEIDGCVRLKGSQVVVLPVFIVKEDVDFSTGNIYFIGSVIVNGDVKSGFKIKAKNDVQVNGVVEDAFIKSGGSVLLKKGFIGRGKGKIIAKEEVRALFCENENIVCEGDIYISDYVMNSNIQTGGNLVVKDKTGLIVGGEIYAVKGIEAKVIGNQNHAPTNLFVGVYETIKNGIQKLKKNLAELEEEITKIDHTLHKFARLKQVKKVLPEDQEISLDKLSGLKTKKEKHRKRLTDKIKELESKVNELQSAVVKITGTVYPRTSITIYDKNVTVKEAMIYVYFKYMFTDEELVAADLEEIL